MCAGLLLTRGAALAMLIETSIQLNGSIGFLDPIDPSRTYAALIMPFSARPSTRLLKHLSLLKQHLVKHLRSDLDTPPGAPNRSNQLL